MTSTLTCPRSTTERFRAAAEDPRTTAGLRTALKQLRDHGWDSPAGTALLDALTVTCTNLASSAEARYRLPTDPARRDDLLSRAWELIETRRTVLLLADNPWAYLTTCLRREMINIAVADALHVTPTTVRNGTATRAGIQPPIRVETTDLVDTVAVPTLGDEARDMAGWDQGLLNLHALLVEHGAPAETTTAAIERITEIAASTRRSRRESAVATDPALTRLGLTPNQSRALLGLLIGGRSDGGASSLWLLYRRGGEDEPNATQQVRRRTSAYADPFAARDQCGVSPQPPFDMPRV